MISLNKLIDLMKKGKAPSKIVFNGKEFEYVMKDFPINVRLKDIKKYGIWNNGGYIAENKFGMWDYFFDELDYAYDGVIDENEKSIYILPEGKSVGDDKKTDSDLCKALDKLIENEIKELIKKGILKSNDKN